jgi:hypothetical protein
MEKQIAKLMKNLDLTREEAMEVIEADKQIDKGAKLFELSKEQEKASKQARSTGTKQPTAYKFNTREKKADNDKQHLIHVLTGVIENEGCEVEIINKEREFLFMYNDKKYKVVLSAPRK